MKYTGDNGAEFIKVVNDTLRDIFNNAGLEDYESDIDECFLTPACVGMTVKDVVDRVRQNIIVPDKSRSFLEAVKSTDSHLTLNDNIEIGIDEQRDIVYFTVLEDYEEKLMFSIDKDEKVTLFKRGI